MGKWIGLDVGGTTIKGAAVLESGNIVVKVENCTKEKCGTEFVLDTMAATVHQIMEKSKWNWSDVNGIGIGLPAFLDFDKGVVETAVNLGWENVPIIDEMKKRLPQKTEIYIENDANAAALGEVGFGAGKGFSDAICITLGTGIGGGVIVNNRIIHGSNGMTGEIGHITIDPDGRLCNCGRQGCLETISSATGIVSIAKEIIESRVSTSLNQYEELNAKIIFDEAANGDAVAQNVLTKAINALAFALSNICCVLNPQVIVIGGGVSKAGDSLLIPLRKSFERYALPRIVEGTTLRLAKLGNDAGVIGAALLHRCLLHH